MQLFEVHVSVVGLNILYSEEKDVSELFTVPCHKFYFMLKL